MHVDKSSHSVLAVCDCGWRELRPTPARAWTALARHVKASHGDPYAAKKIANTARRAAQREKYAP